MSVHLSDAMRLRYHSDPFSIFAYFVRYIYSIEKATSSVKHVSWPLKFQNVRMYVMFDARLDVRVEVPAAMSEVLSHNL